MSEQEIKIHTGYVFQHFLNKPPQARHIRIKQTQLGMTSLSPAYYITHF